MQVVRGVLNAAACFQGKARARQGKGKGETGTNAVYQKGLWARDVARAFE